MRGTATWAGDWCKVVASFKENFWRKSAPPDAGVAKFGGAHGLMAVTWEAADPDDLGEKGACLAGVNFGKNACGKLQSFGAHADAETGRSNEKLTEAVRRELASAFGEEVIEEQLVAVYHQAWTSEKYTWDDGDDGKLASGEDPRRLYGHPSLKKIAEWGVHFAGTETESKSGHVDGAVAAGLRVAKEIKDAIGAPTKKEEL
jgi:monoamine oxidase